MMIYYSISPREIQPSVSGTLAAGNAPAFAQAGTAFSSARRIRIVPVQVSMRFISASALFL